MHAFSDLLDVVRRTRALSGGGGDRAPRPADLAPDLLGRAFEVVEAVESRAGQGVAEALGGLLLVALDLGEASGPDIVEAALVAARAGAATPEVGGQPSVLDGLPTSLPALVRAHAIQRRAASIGFDWPDRTGVRAKVDEELAELDDAVDRAAPDDIEDELGDLLFSVVNLSRFLPADPDAALRRANRKFEARFRAVEARAAAAGLDVQTAGLDRLETLWQEVKRDERATTRGT